MHSVHPLPREWGRGRCRGRRGEGAACPRAPPFRANGEGWGRVACPRVPPSRTYRGSAANGEGWRRVGKGRCWGRRVLVRPFMGRGGPGRGGEGGGGVSSYAPLLCEWAARPREKGWEGLRGETAACPRAHSFRANGKGGAGERGRGRTGGDREKGRRRAHARPFQAARTWGKGTRRALVHPPFLHAKGRR
ncbi:hypothetical protein EDB84DRAFT_1554389, partial [Lactarius hengduanensis]